VPALTIRPLIDLSDGPEYRAHAGLARIVRSGAIAAHAIQSSIANGLLISVACS
jgi:hypothetical protein